MAPCFTQTQWDKVKETPPTFQLARNLKIPYWKLKKLETLIKEYEEFELYKKSTEVVEEPIDLPLPEQFQSIMNKEHDIVIVSGAGLNSSLGVPTFRKGATMEAKLYKKMFYYNAYNARFLQKDWEKELANDISKLLITMKVNKPTFCTDSVFGFLREIRNETICHFTQNVDNSATYYPQGVGIHGTLSRMRCHACSHQCNLTNEMKDALADGILVECVKCQPVAASRSGRVYKNTQCRFLYPDIQMIDDLRNDHYSALTFEALQECTRLMKKSKKKVGLLLVGTSLNPYIKSARHLVKDLSEHCDYCIWVNPEKFENRLALSCPLYECNLEMNQVVQLLKEA